MPSKRLRLIRPLTRAGGRVSRSFANSPQHPRRYFGIEPKSWLRPAAELDRPQLDCVGIDPGALDPEAPRQLRGIDQLPVLESPLFQQLDHPAGDVCGSSLMRADGISIPLSSGRPGCIAPDPRKGGFPSVSGVEVGALGGLLWTSSSTPLFFALDSGFVGEH